MNFLNSGILLIVSLSVLTVGTIAQYCHWEVDWENDKLLNISNTLDPFEQRELLSSQIDLMGRLWNAQTIQEATGYICIEYGPSIYSYTSEEEIRENCDDVVGSLRKSERFNILDDCRKLWFAFGLDQDLSQNIELYIEQCVDVNAGLNTLFLNNLRCNPAIFFADNIIGIVERVSGVVFEVLDWLGPSPFSGDAFGACSLARSMLTMKNQDILQHLIDILTYPIADGLEFLQLYDACSSTDTDTQELLSAVDQLQLVNGDICEFLVGQPSREQYLDASRELLMKIFYLPTDEALCSSLLELLSEVTDNQTLYTFFGSDLSSPSNRSLFCNRIASSFEPSAQYSAITYNLPDGQSFSNWTAFSLPGQILPNFSVLDTVDLLAAIGRPETLGEGVSVLCSVFDSFVDEISDSTLPSQLCSEIKMKDYEQVEEVCLELIVPMTNGFNYPISLRKPNTVYMTVIAIDTLRRLFSLEAISRIQVCRALDEFYHSGHSVQSLVRFLLASYLTELLPIVDDICNDYDNVISHLRNDSSLDPAMFDEMVELVTTGVLAHLGFSTQAELCNAIALGIDRESGRPTDALVSRMATESLQFLTDINRCEDTAKTWDLLADELLEVGYADLIDVLSIYNGMQNSTGLCKEVTNAFSSSREDLCSVDFRDKDDSGQVGVADRLNFSLWLLAAVCSQRLFFYH